MGWASSRAMSRTARMALVMAVLLAALPGAALAHGDEEGMDSELEELARQPARILAQQALALLEVRGDLAEAGERLEAAIESDDQADVDIATLEQAAVALEGGDTEAAIALVDQSLSRPLGAEQGKALHEAGRDYRPAVGAQEIVAIIAGAALLVLGAVALLFDRRRRAVVN